MRALRINSAIRNVSLAFWRLLVLSERQHHPAMSRGTLRLLLILEAVICFALPAYFLVWGLLTLPVWLQGTGSLDNAINVASTSDRQVSRD